MKPESKNNPRQRKKKLTSLLGLTLDGSRLEGVVLKRTNGSLQQLQSFTASLTLDPLTAAPELVAREIRNHLDAAQVREKNCVVGLPLRWVLTAQTELPGGLADADAASLLQLEAEKNFHTDVAQLQLAHSTAVLPEEKRAVLLAGMPTTHIGTIEQILGAAKLKPVSLALGITALQPTEKTDGVLAFVIGEAQIGLQIVAGGGVVALRTLEGVIENAGSGRDLNTAVVVREARITLGQLPVALREKVKAIRIFGAPDLAQRLADELELRFEPMGFEVAVVAGYGANEFGVTLPPQATFSAAFSLAANVLVERKPAFEFLPPKPNPIQQFIKKYTSGKFGVAGAVAAGIAVIVAGLFIYQQINLWVLRSKWSGMSAKVTELQHIQEQIRFYRPWYDETFPALAILRQLTLAFPEDGAVTAKTITVRDGKTVSCSGNVRDISALLAMQAKLRTMPGVAELHLSQQRGKSPMQFTFDFQYEPTKGGAQ